MIRLVSFADSNMTKALSLCCESAAKYGVDVCWPQNPNTISDEFHYFNKEIFANERGFGNWLWKPYFIYKALLVAEENDILIYSDAGVQFINNVSHIIDRMDQDIFFFTNTYPNHHWTKRYVLDQMMPGWEKVYEVDTPWPQVQASAIFFKVCQKTRDFVKRWLLWCQMPGFINDTTGEEYRFYQEHRHDQSILTILATQEGYRLHWWPTVYSDHIKVEGDSYPVIFSHHRLRNHEYKS